jgi:dihydroorotate dehydrogenase electron transfer subunit
MENNQLSKKGQFEAKVTFNKKLAEGFGRLGLQFTGPGAEAFGGTRPGQFAQFDLSNVSIPAPEAIPEDLKDASARQVLLRRPFSFAKVQKDKTGTTVEVVYCVVGPATLRMTTLVKGNLLNIIGPLGSSFTIPKGKKRVLLVGGGMGSPPLEHLAQAMTAESPAVDIVAFMGAKAGCKLPFEKRLDNISRELGFWLGEFAKYSVGSFVATDDGSVGFKGTVTDCLKEWITLNNIIPAETIIFACGPRAMLAGIAKLAAEKKIDCQVSMEETMACGIGLCQSCAIRCVAPPGGGIPAGDKGAKPAETIYKLCCKDGPVFDSKDVVF